jgi:TRAP-type C4-dicarboxylate transport system permease small subunit
MNCPKCGIELEQNGEVCPECGPVYGSSKNIFDKIARIEEILLTTFLGAMVLLVLIQIFLRNVFHSGIAGGDSIVRHLVLWLAFLGAGLAARNGAHVRIDVASRIVPQKWKRVVRIIVDIFSIVVCSILVFAAYEFVSVEYEGQGVIPFLNIPVWLIQIIIPFGYLIITLRFASSAYMNIIKTVKDK